MICYVDSDLSDTEVGCKKIRTPYTVYISSIIHKVHLDMFGYRAGCHKTSLWEKYEAKTLHADIRVLQGL